MIGSDLAIIFADQQPPEAKVVRVAGVEPALLSELDFEGSRVYKKAVPLP